jgi:hypothetical protein
MSNDITTRSILICKPEQSGKTFIMIQEIIKDIEYPPENDKKVINFILCDNNLLLTSQTSSRLNQSIGNDYLELSSRKIAKKKISHEIVNNKDSVICQIISGKISNVICCTNACQKTNIIDIITTIEEKCPHTCGKYIFKIWLDEADKFIIKYIIEAFHPLLRKFENIYLYCITATPEPLFKKLEQMNVYPLENTTDNSYHGWEDNNIVKYDLNELSGEEFVNYILENIDEKNILNGSKWYIPGEYRKESHKNICDICNNKGFVVIIINGDGISVVFPNKQVDGPHKKDKLLNIMIDDLYKDLNLNEYPVAVTGYLCVGRGISFINENFMFDYGILSMCSNKQEASQNAGRLKGNIKHLKNYKVPTVYTTTQFNKIAIESEKKARKLAEIAFEKINDGELPIIEKKTFDNIVKEGGQYDNRKHEIFENREDAIKFKISLGSNTNQKETDETDKAPCTLLDKAGNNPTINELLRRWYGISDKSPVRMVPLNNGKYCVYWDLSFIKKK